MTALRLVIFDVDGTLVDSQAHITASMDAAFRANGLPPPGRAETLGIVGLSLPVAMEVLAPEHPDRRAALVEAYKDAFASLRQDGDAAVLSPLFTGARTVLETLAADDETLLAIATGKSRRGLEHLFELHGFRALFQSVQCADDHPSKPHPSMVQACLRETGVDADRAVILGDTRFDIDMGRAAGIHALGVDWGYHPGEALLQSGARQVLRGFDEVPCALAAIWKDAA